MTIRKLALMLLLGLTIQVGCAQEFEVVKVGTVVNSSYRGLSVVDDRVAWVSGNQGMVGKTIDGGKTWDIRPLAGHEKLDFRSLYAFDEHRAVIANAGSPASILFTKDGGLHWELSYTNTHPEIFFDGIDFWNEKDGIIYGDPIDGRMTLMVTSDGGRTWRTVADPPSLVKGEASFAASGTGIRCIGNSNVMICTGGMASRLWSSSDRGNHWTAINPPVSQGTPTTGMYSFAIFKDQITVVGGDYSQDALTNANHFYSQDGGKSWHAPASGVRGYRECVEFITGSEWLSVGPSGIDVSTDGGVTWRGLADERGLHTARKARKGTLVLLTGSSQGIYSLKRK